MKGSTVFRSKTSEKKKKKTRDSLPNVEKKNTGCIRCIITQQG